MGDILPEADVCFFLDLDLEPEDGLEEDEVPVLVPMAPPLPKLEEGGMYLELPLVRGFVSSKEEDVLRPPVELVLGVVNLGPPPPYALSKLLLPVVAADTDMWLAPPTLITPPSGAEVAEAEVGCRGVKDTAFTWRSALQWAVNKYCSV